jgi:hypothetical protein
MDRQVFDAAAGAEIAERTDFIRRKRKERLSRTVRKNLDGAAVEAGGLLQSFEQPPSDGSVDTQPHG